MSGATYPPTLMEGSLLVTAMLFSIDRDKLLAMERATVEKGKQ